MAALAAKRDLHPRTSAALTTTQVARSRLLDPHYISAAAGRVSAATVAGTQPADRGADDDDRDGDGGNEAAGSRSGWRGRLAFESGNSGVDLYGSNETKGARDGARIAEAGSGVGEVEAEDNQDDRDDRDDQDDQDDQDTPSPDSEPRSPLVPCDPPAGLETVDVKHASAAKWNAAAEALAAQARMQTAPHAKQGVPHRVPTAAATAAPLAGAAISSVAPHRAPIAAAAPVAGAAVASVAPHRAPVAAAAPVAGAAGSTGSAGAAGLAPAPTPGPGLGPMRKLLPSQRVSVAGKSATGADLAGSVAAPRPTIVMLQRREVSDVLQLVDVTHRSTDRPALFNGCLLEPGSFVRLLYSPWIECQILAADGGVLAHIRSAQALLGEYPLGLAEADVRVPPRAARLRVVAAFPYPGAVPARPADDVLGQAEMRVGTIVIVQPI